MRACSFGLRVRWCVRACARPCACACVGLRVCVRALQGTLSGRGMRATYVPAAFAQAQLAAVRQASRAARAVTASYFNVII